MTEKTKFYTEQFGQQLFEVDQIIPLQKGDVFLGSKGEHYEITWKVYNANLNLMIYHGKMIVP